MTDVKPRLTKTGDADGKAKPRLVKDIGGGGGGSSTYAELPDKPKINNVELVGNKTLAQLGIAAVTEETQIKGWTAITPDTYEELDLTTELNSGKKKFTIIVYVRKGQIRQAIKFELTTSELSKILSKVNRNMVCITRSCVDPTNDTKIAMLKQCMEQVYDGDTKVDGHIKLKYGIYTLEGTLITALDNFEWCFYAE